MKKITLAIILLSGMELHSVYASSLTLSLKLVQRVETNVVLNGADISSGADTPVGTVLYQGYLKNNQGDHKNFDFVITNTVGEGSYYFDTKITYSTSNLKLINAAEKIYATNIPGVGIQYISYEGNPVLSGDVINTNQFGPFYIGSTFPSGFNTSWNEYNVKFKLIKVGDISPGFLDGNSLGRITLTQYIMPSSKGEASVSIDNGQEDMAWFTFSGGINITVPTCTTPRSYDVQLGKYDVSSIDRKGYSDWVDSSIVLTGCPTFFGNPGNNENIWSSDWAQQQASVSYIAPNVANVIGVTLNGVQGNANVNNGEINIDKSVPDSATEVLIQIARGTPASNSPLILGQEFNENLPQDGRSVVKIPLVARIKKANDNPSTPGVVYSQATYIINYK